MAGQQMTLQPQFHVIQQPTFAGQQYATFPQFAYTNQQGQIVLQPAHFTTIPGAPGQQGHQQVILTGMPQQQQQPPQQQQKQQPGQMIAPSPQQGGPQGKPPGQQQPQTANYTINSNGQLMPGGPPHHQTFMLAPGPQMGGPPGLPGTVTLSGAPNGHTQTIQTSMAGMKPGDGKAGGPQQQQLLGGGPPQLTAQQAGGPPQFVIPHGGMTYMQAGPHPILHNGQIIVRTQGGQDQQVMFSPAGPAQPHQLQPHQLQQQQQQQQHAPGPMQQGLQQPQQQQVQPQQQQHLQQVRQVGGMPGVGGPPPGKTAISRAIAPLLPNVTQTTARMGYNGNNGSFPNQPSPKSKQKMSPRSGAGGGGVGRPAGPKGAPMKMVPRMAAGSSPGMMPGSPGSPGMMPPGSPRSLGPPLQTTTAVGPPTLSPMLGGNPDNSSQAQMAQQQQQQQQQLAAAPLPSATTMSVGPNQYHHHTHHLTNNKANGATPPPTLPPLPASSPSLQHQQQQQQQHALDPPTLTKEINGPPNQLTTINATAITGNTTTPTNSLPPSAGMKPLSASGNKPLGSFSGGEGEAGLGVPTTTPKAVVKPQVLTHVIDGHIIKESSQPFPVSPVKGNKNSLVSHVYPIYYLLPGITVK